MQIRAELPENLGLGSLTIKVSQGQVCSPKPCEPIEEQAQRLPFPSSRSVPIAQQFGKASSVLLVCPTERRIWTIQ